MTSRPFLLISLLVLALASTACVSNHTLPTVAGLDAPELAAALDDRPGEPDALIDLQYLPLLHLDLKTFARNGAGESYPEGHEFLSLRSWLPLFLLVDGEVRHFDTEHEAYERSAFTSVLWGLWSRSRTSVRTAQGERTERDGRFLWFIDWEDSIAYAQP